MLAFLWKLLVGSFGCDHKWVETDRFPVNDYILKTYIHTLVHMKCDKCGDVKEKKL